MEEQVQPLTLAALYARVSSDRQDMDLSVAGVLLSPGSLETARRLRGPILRLGAL